MLWSGGKTRNRTGDTLIFSQLLYQLSYLAPNVRDESKGGARGASTGISHPIFALGAPCLFAQGLIYLMSFPRAFATLQHDVLLPAF